MPHIQKAFKYKCDRIKGTSGGLIDAALRKDNRGDREPSGKAFQRPFGVMQRNPPRNSERKQDLQQKTNILEWVIGREKSA